MCFSIQVRACSLRFSLTALGDLALRVADARARLRHAVDDLGERRREQAD